MQAVLCTGRNMRNNIFHLISFLKLVLQETPSIRTRLQIERMGQKVVRSRIFIHTTDQVRYCIQEMLIFYHRRI